MAEMPIPIDSESTQVYEEARSVLGSAITQLIGIVRQIINYVMAVSRQIITYAGEHPLALILLMANVTIWMS